MLDRAGDEGAVERAVEHGGDEIGRRSRSAGSAAPPESAGEIRRAAAAGAPRPWFPSSRSPAVPSARHRRARPASLRATAPPSAAHRATGGGRRRSRSCRGCAARTTRVPISASSAFTRCVMLDCTVLSSSAARVMPPVRATVENVTRSDQFHGNRSVSLSRWQHSQVFIYQRMLAGLDCAVQNREEPTCRSSTPLTTLLGISHPILPAPMDVIAGARLTSGGERGRRFWHSGRRLRRTGVA